MGLIGLLILIAVVGLIAWVLISVVPMPQQFKTIILVVALLVVLLVVVRAFGLTDVALTN